MSAPLDEQQLAEIRARADAATPGPWSTYDDGTGRLDIVADLEETGTGYTGRREIAQTVESPMDNDPSHLAWSENEDLAQSQADGRFIASARTDVPALLAEVERLHASATGAWRCIDDTVNYLATRNTTDWPAEALGLGLDIVAHIDGPGPRTDETVPPRPALPWSAFLTDVEAAGLVEELASVFLDYWRGERKADAATLGEVERLLVAHRDGSQAAEAAGKDTGGGSQPPAGESTHTADFFQPGRTYTDGNGYRAPELVAYFRVEHITRHPTRGHLRAIGWIKSGTPDAQWHGHFQDEGEFEGWTEVTDGGEA